MEDSRSNADGEHPLVRVGAAQPLFREISDTETDKQKLIADVEAHVEHTAEMVELAARLGVQIVCLPEDLAAMGNHSLRRENLPLTRQVLRETADGLIETFTRAAARSKIHVVGCAYLPRATFSTTSLS